VSGLSMAGSISVGFVVVADWCGSWQWWQLSRGQKGKFLMHVATASLVPYHVREDFVLEWGGRAWKTKTTSFLEMDAR